MSAKEYIKEHFFDISKSPSVILAQLIGAAFAFYEVFVKQKSFQIWTIILSIFVCYVYMLLSILLVHIPWLIVLCVTVLFKWHENYSDERINKVQFYVMPVFIFIVFAIVGIMKVVL